MSDTPVGPGYWQASDGRWYAPELYPGWGQPPTPVAPPSQAMAWVFTLLTALSCWLLLPAAIVYTRKARREAESAPGLYRWSAWNPLNHPVLLFVGATFLTVGLMVGMQVVAPAGP